jgi:hypothetical protein
MSKPYFYGLNTFPAFLVQSVDVTFSGQNKVYMVCTGLHPDAPRWGLLGDAGGGVGGPAQGLGGQRSGERAGPPPRRARPQPQR